MRIEEKMIKFAIWRDGDGYKYHLGGNPQTLEYGACVSRYGAPAEFFYRKMRGGAPKTWRGKPLHEIEIGFSGHEPASGWATSAEIKSAASTLGRNGRAVNSLAQQQAARDNGKKGGRPRKPRE